MNRKVHRSLSWHIGEEGIKWDKTENDRTISIRSAPSKTKQQLLPVKVVRKHCSSITVSANTNRKSHY